MDMTTTVHENRARPARRIGRLLVAVEAVVAVNAMGGAIYGLAGADNVPREWLDGTPFSSYAIPSLILLVAVGGGMSLAAVALLARHRFAPELSIVAGLLLIGWITTQVLIIVPDGGFSWLQPAMFAAAALVTALGWQLRRENNAPQGRRIHAHAR